MGAVDSRQFTVYSKNLWLVKIKNALAVNCRLSTAVLLGLAGWSIRHLNRGQSVPCLRTYFHFSGLICCKNLWKRGSLRRNAHAGLTIACITPSSRAASPFSSQSKVWSLSPSQA